MQGPRVHLSVVVPVYGCRSCLHALHERLSATLAEVTSAYEIVYVDDGTEDGTWPALRTLARTDAAVRAIRLSRNFGQQAAIVAGLEHTSGRHVAVMDCDLQDPPEVLATMYGRAIEGFPVVYGARLRNGTPPFRRAAAWCYAAVLNATTHAGIDPRHGCFSLMSREVVDAYLRVPDRDRNHTMILYWLGFPSATVTYDQPARHSGDSAYTVRSLVRLAADSLFFHTTALLRWVIYLGFAVALCGLGLAIYYTAVKVTSGAVPAGFTALAVLILVMTGFTITSVGVTGLYVGRVFEQVKGRPLYVVAEATDLHGDAQPETARERPHG